MTPEDWHKQQVESAFVMYQATPQQCLAILQARDPLLYQECCAELADYAAEKGAEPTPDAARIFAKWFAKCGNRPRRNGRYMRAQVARETRQAERQAAADAKLIADHKAKWLTWVDDNVEYDMPRLAQQLRDILEDYPDNQTWVSTFARLEEAIKAFDPAPPAKQ